MPTPSSSATSAGRFIGPRERRRMRARTRPPLAGRRRLRRAAPSRAADRRDGRRGTGGSRPRATAWIVPRMSVPWTTLPPRSARVRSSRGSPQGTTRGGCTRSARTGSGCRPSARARPGSTGSPARAAAVGRAAPGSGALGRGMLARASDGAMASLSRLLEWLPRPRRRTSRYDRFRQQRLLESGVPACAGRTVCFHRWYATELFRGDHGLAASEGVRRGPDEVIERTERALALPRAKRRVRAHPEAEGNDARRLGPPTPGRRAARTCPRWRSTGR